MKGGSSGGLHSVLSAQRRELTKATDRSSVCGLPTHGCSYLLFYTQKAAQIIHVLPPTTDMTRLGEIIFLFIKIVPATVYRENHTEVCVLQFGKLTNELLLGTWSGTQVTAAKGSEILSPHPRLIVEEAASMCSPVG